MQPRPAGLRLSSRPSSPSSTRWGLNTRSASSSVAGEPAEDLIDVAHEVNADFIVIGLRRRTPVGKLILGSTPKGDPLFKIGKLHVFQQDRAVILGRNGAGKSQLVRLLRKAAAEPGSVAGIKVSPTVVTGYSDQDMSQLPLDISPLEFITGSFHLGDQRSKALLAGAGCATEKQEKRIAELSFGQRARLGLLALRLTEPNFYLLDEPTNHVDIAGQEALESEILANEACSILVSHDRRLVRSVGTRFLLIEGSKLIEIDSPEPFFAKMAAERD